MNCLHEYLGRTGGKSDCGPILFTRQWLLQSVLSAVVRGSSRSALLTICCMVSCDYSPRRQKKKGEISSAVVSDLHTLSISSAQLLSVRPSATEHVQQLYCYILESNRAKKIYRERLLWFTVPFSFLFLSASSQFYLIHYAANFDINISSHILFRMPET